MARGSEMVSTCGSPLHTPTQSSSSDDDFESTESDDSPVPDCHHIPPHISDPSTYRYTF